MTHHLHGRSALELDQSRRFKAWQRNVVQRWGKAKRLERAGEGDWSMRQFFANSRTGSAAPRQARGAKPAKRVHRIVGASKAGLTNDTRGFIHWLEERPRSIDAQIAYLRGLASEQDA